MDSPEKCRKLSHAVVILGFNPVHSQKMSFFFIAAENNTKGFVLKTLFKKEEKEKKNNLKNLS